MPVRGRVGEQLDAGPDPAARTGRAVKIGRLGGRPQRVRQLGDLRGLLVEPRRVAVRERREPGREPVDVGASARASMDSSTPASGVPSPAGGAIVAGTS